MLLNWRKKKSLYDISVASRFDMSDLKRSNVFQGLWLLKKRTLASGHLATMCPQALQPKQRVLLAPGPAWFCLSRAS